MKQRYLPYLPALVALAGACGGNPKSDATAGQGGASTATLASDTRSSTTGAEGDDCGFEEPAFCETFEDGPQAGGRSGELDEARFSVARGMPYNPSSFDDAFRIGPALIGDCR